MNNVKELTKYRINDKINDDINRLSRAGTLGMP